MFSLKHELNKRASCCGYLHEEKKVTHRLLYCHKLMQVTKIRMEDRYFQLRRLKSRLGRQMDCGCRAKFHQQRYVVIGSSKNNVSRFQISVG